LKRTLEVRLTRIQDHLQRESAAVDEPKRELSPEAVAEARRIFEELTAQALARNPHAMDEHDRAARATLDAMDKLNLPP
jgi:hypothetical protein